MEKTNQYSFTNATGDGPVRIEFEQRGERFRLLQGFRFVDSDGSGFAVEPDDDCSTTDLASVPEFARWYVNSYGKHTLAAVLHDRLVEHVDPRRVLHVDRGVAGGVANLDRPDADDVFHSALSALGVDAAKRRTMWATVVLWTRLRHSGWPTRFWLVVWFLCAAAGVSSVVAGLVLAAVTGDEWWSALTIGGVAGPWPGSAFWWSRWRAGLWAAHAILLIGPPLAVIGMTHVTRTLVNGMLGRHTTLSLAALTILGAAGLGALAIALA